MEITRQKSSGEPFYSGDRMVRLDPGHLGVPRARMEARGQRRTLQPTELGHCTKGRRHGSDQIDATGLVLFLNKTAEFK